MKLTKVEQEVVGLIIILITTNAPEFQNWGPDPTLGVTLSGWISYVSFPIILCFFAILDVSSLP